MAEWRLFIPDNLLLTLLGVGGNTFPLIKVFAGYLGPFYCSIIGFWRLLSCVSEGEAPKGKFSINKEERECLEDV